MQQNMARVQGLGLFSYWTKYMSYNQYFRLGDYELKISEKKSNGHEFLIKDYLRDRTKLQKEL